MRTSHSPCLGKKVHLILVITSVKIDQFSKVFHWQIHKETLYEQLTIPPHLNYAATLPCQICKFKTTAKLLLLP